MALTRLDLRGHVGPFAPVLPKPQDGGADVRDTVTGIIERVRREGDDALRALTLELDRVEVEALRVGPEEVAAALDRIPTELREALTVANRRICEYHALEAGIGIAATPTDNPGHAVGGAMAAQTGAMAEQGGAVAFVSDGVTVRPLVRPVARAGCYAPGGRARYPSTVLMCTGPARVAGVEEVVLCVPPAPDGRIDDATLAAAAIAGVDEVYAVGGAQAIAAMAYGTETIRPVDVVVGPGNRYVAEAIRQVSGVVGVAAAFAGPSEVVVVAGPEAPPELVAADLVVQAEHGPDGMAWLVTWDPELASAVEAAVDSQVAVSPRRADLEATLRSRGYSCIVDDARAAVAVANVVAPEHLELMTEEAEQLLPLVSAAGAVFLGMSSPASMGDYVAGPNHVLPTDRSARFASALRADDFRRHIHAVTITPEGLAQLGPHAITLATTEGLPGHAASVRLRLRS